MKLALGLNPTKIKSIVKFNKTILDQIADSAIEKYKLQEAEKYFVDIEKRNIAKDEKMFGALVPDIKESKIKAAHERFKNLSHVEKQDFVRKRGFDKGELEIVAKEEIKGYEIDFTVHSLGAVLADCAAADMHLELKSRGIAKDDVHLSSTTFDNPGAITPVKKICKKGHISINDLKSEVKYKVFNNRDNFINTLDKQVGEKYQIVPDGQKPRGGFANMCAWIAKKLPGRVAKKLFGFLSFGKLSSQAKDHSLTNFNDVLVEGKGVVKGRNGKVMTMEEATTGIEPIEFDKEIFESIKSISSDSSLKSKPQFSMADPENKDSRIEFSESQLKEVMKAKEKSSTTKKFSTASSRAKNAIKNIIKSKEASKDKSSKYQYSQKYKKRTAQQVISKAKNLSP